jgi:hypothetical protein
MPVLQAGFAHAIKALSEKEKEKIILRFARANAEMHDKLAFELLEEVTLESLYEEGQTNITEMLMSIPGRSFVKGLSRQINKAAKEIARIKKITKDAKLEADLILFLVQYLTENFGGQFDSHYRSFSNKVARLTLKLHTLLVKNVHADLLLDYEEPVNELLTLIRKRTEHQNLSVTLPAKLR